MQPLVETKGFGCSRRDTVVSTSRAAQKIPVNAGQHDDSAIHESTSFACDFPSVLLVDLAPMPQPCTPAPDASGQTGAALKKKIRYIRSLSE